MPSKDVGMMMNTRAEPFSVHKYRFLPSKGVILDVSPVFAYIYANPALRAISSFTGIHDFLSNMCWDATLGRQSMTWEYIESIEYRLMEEDIEAPSLMETIDVEPRDLAAAMRGLEDYLETEFFRHLEKGTRDEFIKRGFCIAKWLTSTQAVFETLTGEDVPRTDERAVFRSRAFADLGHAPRI